MTYRIYVLKDPREDGTESIKYVGATSASLSDRLQWHVRDTDDKDGTSPRLVWLRELLDSGIWPEIEMVESAVPDAGMAAKRENVWMDHFRSQGCSLLNVRRGGGGLSDSRDSGPSAWASSKMGVVPDRIIARHDRVHPNTVARWRGEIGFLPYRDLNELFSSLCTEMADAVSVWGSIVTEKEQLEAYGIPGKSVYEDWVRKFKVASERVRDVRFPEDSYWAGCERAMMSYCSLRLTDLKTDMILSGHGAIMGLHGMYVEIMKELENLGDDVTLDDLDVWVSTAVLRKRVISPDVYEYDYVMGIHDRYIEKLREMRRRYEQH